jgi:hypothetical protein
MRSILRRLFRRHVELVRNHTRLSHPGETVTASLARSRVAVPVLASAALALSASVAMAATPGDLDPSFDGDGKRVLPYGFTPAVEWARSHGHARAFGNLVLDDLG